MPVQITTRRVAFAAALLAVCALYLTGLSRMGLVSTDEPRYADIGRAMAQSGDWVTPRLFGQPWFEKPPLLYWLEALGYRMGLGPEIAPRLPVAGLSVIFLIVFWRKVRLLWDERTACFAVAMLATSAGWLAFSHVAVTDVPLAVMFSMALLFFLERRFNAAAAALGFAVLAKSLVPLVLFAPVLVLDFTRWREWLRPAPVGIFLIVAVPWHVICAMRNGAEFVNVLFFQQQFGRFFSAERQHVQGWWFYVPVLLLLLFPWFPLLPLAVRGFRDQKGRILAAVVAVGFVFFSASLNKLPGYLLPLIPALCVLMGAGAARVRDLRPACALAAGLVGMLPLGAVLLPDALAESLSRAIHSYHLGSFWILAIPAASAAAIVMLRRHTFAVCAGGAAAALLWFQISTSPALDKAASARPQFMRQQPLCIEHRTERRMVYGFDYYSGRALPDCAVLDQTGRSGVR